ncbi:MAG: hypothetical protein V4710_04530 [Verrucomicrobiota bacterium]
MNSLRNSIPTFFRLLGALRRIIPTLFRLLGVLRRNSRRIAFIAACLATLAVVFYTVERWRWRSQWNRYEAEARTRGARLYMADLERPPLPDAENFAAIPLFQEFFRDPKSSDQINGYVFSTLLGNKIMAARSHGLASAESLKALFSSETRAAARARKVQLSEGIPAVNTAAMIPGLLNDQSKPLPEGILALLNEETGPVWNQLREALPRPSSSLSSLANKPSDETYVRLPFIRVRKAAQIAVIHLHLDALQGDGGAAFEDLQILLRLANATTDDVSLVAAMIRIAVMQLAMDGVWSGLGMEIWDEAALVKIDGLLSGIDLLRTCQFGLECERAQQNAFYEQFIAGDFSALFEEKKKTPFICHFFPTGWVYRNRLLANQAFDRMIQQVDPARRTLTLAHDIEREIEKRMTSISRFRDLIYLITTPNYLRSGARSAMAEATVRQARAACALERYRLSHGSYPETLAPLVDQRLLPAIPLDPMSNAPMDYQLIEGGHYSLKATETDSRTRDVASRECPHAWIPGIKPRNPSPLSSPPETSSE